MKLPSYSAGASLGRSTITYTGAVGHEGWNREAVVPAVSCADVDCGWAQFFCYGSFDLDPISCGIYYGCCKGAGRTGGDTGSGAGVDIPPKSNFPLTSGDSTLSAGFSDLSSQVAGLEKQLRTIAKCVCPPPDLTYLPPSAVPPWVSTVSTERRVSYPPR